MNRPASSSRIIRSLPFLFLLYGSTGWCQTTRPASFPTGLRPLGVAVNGNYAAVANSGDNSVSIFQLNLTPQSASLTLAATVTGIPSPYGVFACGSNTFLVTSPSDNSVRLIQAPQGQIVGAAKTGLQPYAAICYKPTVGGKFTAAVSNLGDSTLTFCDLSTLQITQTVQGIPGTRGFHGIAIHQTVFGDSMAVAGTNGNIVSTFFAQFAVPHPISVFSVASSFQIVSATDNLLSIVQFSTNDLSKTNTVESYSNVPNPRDAISLYSSSVGAGWAATIGDSLWTVLSRNVTVIPGIAGANAIASFLLPEAPLANSARPALLVTSTDSNSVFVLYVPSGPPQSQFAAQSAASPLPVAPGSLASTFMTATGVSQEFNAASLPLPTSLGGVTLSMGGAWNFDWTTGQWSYSPAGSIPAALLYVGPKQINFQIPPGSPTGNILAQIQKPDGSTLLGTINVVATSPSIFTVTQNGQGQAAALNQDYSPNSVTNPALRGSVLQLYLTGAGATNIPLLPGLPADPFGNPLVLTQVQPTVTINAQPAEVLFSGMAPGFVGLWQINVRIPDSTPPGPPVPLVVTAGARSNLVTIAVK